ncbi:MAG: methionyl-tRNA formyltransferase [Parachlamydiales bacterium]
MKLVFFGTPPFSASILHHLIASPFEVVAVVTQPPKPKGRSGKPTPTPVAELAQANHLPTFAPRRPSEIADALRQIGADLFVVAAYGALLKEDLLEMPPMGCINVHTSLLPKYRGAAPIQRAIMAGEEKTGVTIMHMVRELDAGDMILTAEVPIPPDATYGEVEEALCEQGKKLLVRAIHDLQKGCAPRLPQDPSQATYAHKIESDECEIDWRRPARELHNLIRGASPRPGAWCWVTLKGKRTRLKVLRTSLLQGEWMVPCGQGSLSLLEVQLEGKRPLSAKAFLAGHPKEFLQL